MARQIGLLSAGCQPWNSDVCAASGHRFAYCASLAVYIYERDLDYNEYRLLSIMSLHKKTISAISWCPQNRDLLASCGDDGNVIVWNVSSQSVVGRLTYTKCTPRCVQWCLHERDTLSFVTATVPLLLWKYTTANVNVVKETQNFSTDITRFAWHPNKSGKMAFGHNDGSLSILTLRHKAHRNVLRPANLDADDEDPVTSLQWDPLSVDYLLVTRTHNGVQLVDVDELTIITVFQLPSAAMHVHTLSWIPSAPGMFLTGDVNTGILRVWTVAKDTPVENIKLKKTGFHALHVVTDPDPLTNHQSDHTDRTPILSSTSQSQSPVIDAVTRLALPPSCVVCTFLDGGVGVYDLGRRRWLFLREQGHIETIFDCQFKPLDANLLATASFDGSIKIWDITTFQAVHTSPGNEGIIYSLSWAPSDLNCIVAGTARKGVFIWDISKGKIIKRFTEHVAMSAIYSVSWNKIESRRIMSCGADWYCVIRLVDGTPVHRYRHPGIVYGCDWSPHNKDMLATGCDDKCLRVYYVTANTSQPLKVFTGHTAKVFQVHWCPLREGILCSGSDDATIRVWDYTQEACVNVLAQHTAPVRGLIWSTELPYMLVSGSWDSTIRVWDTRDGACIDMALDHGADVYGLAIHPTRPFILASCSRDSTLRLWSLNPLIQPIEMRIIAQHAWSSVMSTPDNVMSQCTPPMLTGKVSKDIKQMVDTFDHNVHSRTLRLFSKFFHQPRGTNNLWELVAVVRGASDSLLSHGYSHGIMHRKHVTLYKASEAQELEMIKMTKFGGGIGVPTKDERLRQAADTFVKLGNVERYCELRVELGDWERALAVAPAVSVVYWRSLMKRYTDFLTSQDRDDVVPFFTATSDTLGLVAYLKSRGRLDDALLVSHVAAEGSDPHQTSEPWDSGVCNGHSDEGDPNIGCSDEHLVLLEATTQHLADWYLRNGSPTLAACHHLAVDDFHGTLAKLIRGHELELAVCVGIQLQKCQSLVNVALGYLSRRCEKLDLWELGVDLLQMTSTKLTPLMQLCSRCAAVSTRIDSIHAKAGLPSLENCVTEGERLEHEGATYNSVCYYLMSMDPVRGLTLGLSHVKEVLKRDHWQVNDVVDMLQMLAAMRNDTFNKQADSLKGELLVLCAYIGALVAIRRQYHTVIAPLFSHALFLLERYTPSVGVSVVDVTADLEAWQAMHVPRTTQECQPCVVSSAIRDHYNTLMQRVGSETAPVPLGEDCIMSSNLPSHSDVHVSLLTGKRIQGPAFHLEDGRSAISINEALMWAKVNPFSPLATGFLINPF